MRRWRVVVLLLVVMGCLFLRFLGIAIMHFWCLEEILLHHVAAGVLVLHPLQYPEHHGYLTAYATIVEVNTLFHSLSKKFKAQKAFVHAFHATWIGLRLGWYPYLLAVVFPRVMQGYSDRVYWQVVGSQAVLVGLNVLWTVEVVYGLLRPKKRKP